MGVDEFISKFILILVLYIVLYLITLKGKDDSTKIFISLIYFLIVCICFQIKFYMNP